MTRVVSGTSVVLVGSTFVTDATPSRRPECAGAGTSTTRQSGGVMGPNPTRSAKRLAADFAWSESVNQRFPVHPPTLTCGGNENPTATPVTRTGTPAMTAPRPSVTRPDRI